MNRVKMVYAVSLWALFSLVQGCGGMMAMGGPSESYDKFSYEIALSLKKEAPDLMNKATTPYDQNWQAVQGLEHRMNQAYRHVKTLKGREEAVALWTNLVDPKKPLLGGFLEKWKRDQSLGKAYVEEVKVNVLRTLNTIIELEGMKKHMAM